jgi:membrane protease YdiL (CAAX protease family)
VQPTVAVGITVVVVYTIILSTIQQSSGVQYDEFFDSASNTWRAPVLALGIGSVLLLAFVAWARWDMLWRDPERLPMTRWTWILLGTFTLCVVIRAVGIAWADIDTELLVAVLCLGVLVGFSEEILFRGIFLRSMRNGRMSEGAAALWTAAAFGLFHLPNVFLGTGLTGLSQIVLAGLSGIALYYFRVAYGAIVVGMVMHGLFDVTTFLSADYGATWSTRVALPIQVITWGLGGLVAIHLFRKGRGYRVTSAGVGHVLLPEGS